MTQKRLKSDLRGVMYFLYRTASAAATCLARPLLFASCWKARWKTSLFAKKGQTKELEAKETHKREAEDSLRRARELCAIEIPTHKSAQKLAGRSYESAPLLWLHGVDIGEAQVALRLAQDLWQQRAHLRVLITTTSRAAARLILRYAANESRLQHRYAPLDNRRWWRDFLRRWQPSLAVRCENEFWPNSIIETRQHCPLLFIQAKMSEKSFRRWQAFSRLSFSVEGGIAQRTMRCIDLALCQDEPSARYLRTLGVRQTKVAGNLKSLPAPRSIDDDTERWFHSLLANKKLWIAASTHAPEEASVVQAHRSLRGAHPDALCIIAPRDLRRVPAIATRLSEQGESYYLRSDQPSSLDASFFLLDSYLELNSLYRWARAVFVGGTLIDKGGHNFFEPARHGCRILHGAYLRNTHATLLRSLRLTQQVRDADDLAACLTQEFDKTYAANSEDEKTKNEARKAIEQHHQTLRASVLQSLEPYLTKLDHA